MIGSQALKDRLRTIALERKIHFNTCWKQLLLERYLARLSSSSHADKFIFKGGFLLSYLMKIGRETTDLDFLITRMKTEQAMIQIIFEEISSIPSTDGFNFSFQAINLLQQPHMEYPGYRVLLEANFENMKDKIQVDVGVGDVVEPQMHKIPLTHYRGRPFFEDEISLLVYPIETILAEKLETIISKGKGNSRMKDYHDLVLMIRNKQLLDRDKLRESVAKTFSNRKTRLGSIEFDEAALNAIQRLWAGHLKGLGDMAQELELPKHISEVIQEINTYLSH